MKNLKHHIFLYSIEIIILVLGFVVILGGNLTFLAELFVLGFILTFYIIVGLIRHTKDHDMHSKVVLEYISISLIIALLFLLINIARF